MSIASRWLIAIVLLVTAVPVQSVSAAVENDYEIPLSELKKVEKKKPKKTETSKRKERKKADTTSQETTREVSGGAAAPSQPVPLGPEAAQRGAEVMETPDNAHISHEPYSYVVPGKRTVIKAVISREAVQPIRCRFRSLDKGGYASVAMVRLPGSQFTYVATLPALEPGTAVLRYRFIVVDASGNQTYSQEFVIPVKPTSVMPGWQQDPAKEPVRVALENPRQPLEGFSDVVMENAERK
ncbi:MAG: hypothetical protein ABSA86_13845 [Oryzomonas sp.]|jgi:hypothetical protein